MWQCVQTEKSAFAPVVPWTNGAELFGTGGLNYAFLPDFHHLASRDAFKRGSPGWTQLPAQLFEVGDLL